MFVRLLLQLAPLRVAAPSLALLLALGACGDGEPTPQASDLTDAERIYLADVLAALRLSFDGFLAHLVMFHGLLGTASLS